MLGVARNITHSFNSLQTGKCIQSWGCPKDPPQRLGFNSLQTGKCIQSLISSSVNALEKIAFQFPSNGKVYSEYYQVLSRERGDGSVSIPFKRESVFRVAASGALTRAFGFNSLQTGKCIQSKRHC